MFGSVESRDVTASGSRTTREASVSFWPLARWALRIVGACHQSRWRVPPPPRFVGAVPRGSGPVLAVVAPAGADPAAVVLVVAPVVVVPAAVVAAGALVPAGALVALPAGRVAAAEPAAVVGAMVAAAPVVGAVVAAGFGVSVAVLPPQAARTIGIMRLNSANNVTRPHRACPCFQPLGILISPYVDADCFLRRENG
jgi:hypothetical protein